MLPQDIGEGTGGGRSRWAANAEKGESMSNRSHNDWKISDVGHLKQV